MIVNNQRADLHLIRQRPFSNLKNGILIEAASDWLIIFNGSVQLDANGKQMAWTFI